MPLRLEGNERFPGKVLGEPGKPIRNEFARQRYRALRWVKVERNDCKGQCDELETLALLWARGTAC